jgi:hypothetical protein
MYQAIKGRRANGGWLANSMNDYALVAHTSPAVYEKLMAEKQHFFKTYDQKQAIQTRPHIALANFSASEAMEDTLIRWIHKICSQQESFLVTLNNYSGIPQHSIFLRLLDANPFKQLAAQLKPIDDYIQSSDCAPMVFLNKPHISLVSKLPEEVYNKAMMDYSQKTFHESFFIQELLLLRKAPLQDDCKTINVFRFQPATNNIVSEVA